MANCAEKVTLVIFHGERERVVRGNHEVISGMPIAVDLTPEASSILCLFRPAPSKKRVLQTCSEGGAPRYATKRKNTAQFCGGQ
jgi:hypothetical protein